MSTRYTVPKYLDAAAAKKYNALYDAGLIVAKTSYPADTKAQHLHAYKEANKMLAVPAPESAAEIDKLAKWQVISRDTRVVDGVDHRVAVTIDGRKYAHPVVKPPVDEKQQPAA